MTGTTRDWAILDRLAAVIAERAGGQPGRSYVAGLLAAGPRTCAQKLGEEAVECALAAAAGETGETVRESADLLFHLLVLWQAAGVDGADVLAELARREGVSGLDEKAGRKG